MVLFKDQGLITNCHLGQLCGQYSLGGDVFGDSHYDGRYWHNF